MDYQSIIESVKEKAEDRFENFEQIPEWEDLLANVDTEAYIQKPKWIWWQKEYVVLFIDLIWSSELSVEKFKWTLAKVYDYFTQSIIDCVDESWFYSYIDIKGDWVFILYEWTNALEEAFIDCITFRTFFSKHVKNRFSSYDKVLKCKCAIYNDKLLVRKIGNKKFRNEVWAWKLINIASKLVNYPQSHWWYPKWVHNFYLVIPKKIYTYMGVQHWALITNACCKEKTNLWKEHLISIDSPLNELESYFVLESVWCEEHGEDTLNQILNP